MEKLKISEIRTLIKKTDKDLEKIVRLCDHCIPIAENRFLWSLIDKSYFSLKNIFYSLEFLEKNTTKEKYRRVLLELQKEADRLMKDYEFIKNQYL
ncbi:MAG: hypothetical protein QXD05_01090 [Candidatus Pacearchaeota archaeon]